MNWQVKELENLWKPYCDRGIVVSDTGEQRSLWNFLREDHFYFAEAPLDNVKLKVNVLPSRLVQWVEVVERQLSRTGSPVFLKAHAGSGIIRVFYHLDPSPTQVQKLAELIEEWRVGLSPVRGSVVVEAGPFGLRSQVDSWGYRSKDLELMKRIKNRLDPRGTLNPGRFVV